MAEKLGFKAGPIEGPTHFSQFVPLSSIPFEPTPEANRIILNLAREGNRPLRMILDTGATFSVMTPLVARSLGVTVRPHKSTPYRRGTSLGRDLQFYIDTSSCIGGKCDNGINRRGCII